MTGKQNAMPAKGERGGECARTACANQNATWYNQSTRRNYCTSCADILNRANRVDAERLFGTSLCVLSSTTEGGGQ
jgi:hypothetical protein